MPFGLQFVRGGAFAVPFRPSWVSALIPRRRSGAYVLFDGQHPRYVGRSDVCLASRLAGHELRGFASHVAWSLSTGDRAWVEECYWFHRLEPGGDLLNRAHPAAPLGRVGQCPFCPPALDAALSAVSALARLGRRSAGPVPPGTRP